MTDDASSPFPPAPDQEGDILPQALSAAIMAHGLRNGALDYPAVASAMILILADIIGPQTRDVRRSMVADFAAHLGDSVRAAANRILLQTTVNNGKPN